MPYLGNTAASRFVSNRAASVYSGDGSTVAFTLEQVVTQDEDILVSVDGVIQEPSVAYAVSSGTTLTFTAAPSTNSGNNIFVYYLASQAGTVGHPSTQGLTATTGTFTGNTTIGTTNTDFDPVANNLIVGTGSGDNGITIFTGSNAGDKGSIFFADTAAGDAANSRKGQISYEQNNEIMTFFNNNILTMQMDANGIITKSRQPAFLVQPSSTQSNMAVATTTVVFGTERYDVGANFASNTFTAPVAGIYFLGFSTYIQNVDSAATFIQLDIKTSNRTFYDLIDPNFSADLNYYPANIGVTNNMDAGDTAIVRFSQGGGTAQADIPTNSIFMGYLLG